MKEGIRHLWPFLGGAAVLVVAFGCDSMLSGGQLNGQEQPGDVDLQIATVVDPDTNIAAILETSQLERVVVLGEKGRQGQATNVTGAAYHGPSGESPVTIWFANDGLPSVAVVDEWMFTFTNYGGGSVDLLATSPTGEITLTSGISLDPDNLEALRQLGEAGIIGEPVYDLLAVALPAEEAQDTNTVSTASLLRSASLGLNIGCCAIGATASPEWIGTPITITCCAASALEIGGGLTDDDVLGVGTTATTTSTCAPADVGGCVGVDWDLVSTLIEDAEGTRIRAQTDGVASGRLTLPSWFESTVGFDFSAGTAVEDPHPSSGDADFHMDGINEVHAWGTGAVMDDTPSIDLSSPPMFGYTTDVVAVAEGDVLVIKTREGGFARMRIVNLDWESGAVLAEYVVLP